MVTPADKDNRAGQIEECLRAFVVAYANGERRTPDLMEAEVFRVWLRACDLLGMVVLRDDRPPLKRGPAWPSRR